MDIEMIMGLAIVALSMIAASLLHTKAIKERDAEKRNNDFTAGC